MLGVLDAAVEQAAEARLLPVEHDVIPVSPYAPAAKEGEHGTVALLEVIWHGSVPELNDGCTAGSGANVCPCPESRGGGAPKDNVVHHFIRVTA